ncbi:ribonuclease P protein component [Kordiimonas sp. SCSIO 12610]|uniref:ribonuclease P protein component n=1 Tax=Kordiimonas sp. SCSIO 12610 TaxID=2829597 RepID=UPI00210E44A1|nr:ribonuclease P protein component [Kordiimonas sp. SCSIO 12610]UTW55366.1 ribonuclease P protein component [Kordiimonas sp. SCSIO 12610]
MPTKSYLVGFFIILTVLNHKPGATEMDVIVTRLTNRIDYLSVAGTRRKWITPSFIIQAKPDHLTSDSIALGFTASKKVGNAVKRNKARRRLKEAARAVVAQHGNGGWAYVIIARESAISYPFEKILSDMKWALVKLNKGADLEPKSKRRSK